MRYDHAWGRVGKGFDNSQDLQSYIALYLGTTSYPEIDRHLSNEWEII